MTEIASGMVEHPNHYQSSAHGDARNIEAIDVIERYGLDDNFCLGSAAKYLIRAGKKGPALVDLKKARWYLERFQARYADGYAAEPMANGDEQSPVGWATPDAIAAAHGIEGAHADALIALLSWSLYGLDGVEDIDSIADGLATMEPCARIIHHIDQAVGQLMLRAAAGGQPKRQKESV